MVDKIIHGKNRTVSVRETFRYFVLFLVIARIRLRCSEEIPKKDASLNSVGETTSVISATVYVATSLQVSAQKQKAKAEVAVPDFAAADSARMALIPCTRMRARTITTRRASML